MANHFNTSGQEWIAGDFNFDGKVNALDFNFLATNFGEVSPSPPAGALAPEPLAIALVTAALWPVMVRRRRRCPITFEFR